MAGSLSSPESDAKIWPGGCRLILVKRALQLALHKEVIAPRRGAENVVQRGLRKGEHTRTGGAAIHVLSQRAALLLCGLRRDLRGLARRVAGYRDTLALFACAL